jgi:hypothetical protein
MQAERSVVLVRDIEADEGDRRGQGLSVLLGRDR